MSEKFLKILLSELTTVRVVCLKCNAVTEVMAAALGHTFQDGTCPPCHQAVFMPSSQKPNPLKLLSDALWALQQQPTPTVSVEFSVKAD